VFGTGISRPYESRFIRLSGFKVLLLQGDKLSSGREKIALQTSVRLTNNERWLKTTGTLKVDSLVSAHGDSSQASTSASNIF